jgi:outer membrane protein assembly factor BamE
MPKHLRALLLAVLACTLASCGLVYKPVTQQGNLIDRKDMSQLKTGMTKSQVIALLGTPAVHSPFDHDRWDYVMLTKVRGKKLEEHKLSLFFEYGTLARTEGQFYGQNANKEQQLLEQSKKYHIESPGKGPRGDKNHGGDTGDGDGS